MIKAILEGSILDFDNIEDVNKIYTRLWFGHDQFTNILQHAQIEASLRLNTALAIF